MNETPENGVAGFFRDDGTKINPELVPKPSLCVTCKKDNDPKEEILCILTRTDQKDEEDFICNAYEPMKRLQKGNDRLLSVSMCVSLCQKWWEIWKFEKLTIFQS